MPQVCLVHREEIFPRHPAMAIRLTPCEQKWVDDVRAGRVHIHLTRKRKPWQNALLLLRQRINTEQMRAGGNINECAPDGARTPRDVQERIHIEVYGRGWAKKTHAAQERLAANPGMQVMEVGSAQYPRKLDISDRWYPRGN